MDLNHIFIIILSSSLIASIFSAIMNIYQRKLDFKNEYFKEIIKKRIKAYEFIENQIALLKISAIDEKDRKPYHIIFSYTYDEYIKFTQNIVFANSYSIWLSEKTYEILKKLLHIFNKINLEITSKNSDLIIKLGKNYYDQIADLRNSLEESIRDDLLNLHEIKQLKHRKKYLVNNILDYLHN